MTNVTITMTLEKIRSTHPRLVARIRHSPTMVDGCWFWVGALASNGYGRIWVDGCSRYVHRVAFEAAHGVQLDSSDVLAHMCDEASCVNPAHIAVGTQAFNLGDAGRKGRLGRGRHGHLDPRRARGRAEAIRAALVTGWDQTALEAALVAGEPIQPSLLPQMA